MTYLLVVLVVLAAWLLSELVAERLDAARGSTAGPEADPVEPLEPPVPG